MSSTTPRRGPTTGTASSSATGRRSAAGGPSTPSTSGVLSSNGTAGSPSPKPSGATGRPARPATRRPLTGSSTNADDGAKAEEARAENAALIDSLRQSLKEAEATSEDYKRQLTAAQEKVDDLMAEQTRLEEQYHASSGRVQELELDQSESRRHAQEMQRIYDSERMSMLKDHEEAVKKEGELKSTIHRLKETIAEREFQLSAGGQHTGEAAGRVAGNTEDENEPQFAPPAMPRQDSQGNRVLVRKDEIIESLRLELADAQIKLIEMEHAGGDRVQDLEKTLLETRMANARLQEDNESFQLLLGERTISGDFQKTQLMQGAGGSDHGPGGLESLAEELKFADEELEPSEGGHPQARRLEAELKSVKDQNKALTLYIEKIISRVLQHDNFETILDQHNGGLGRIPGLGGSTSHSTGAATDKELPPPPPAKDDRTAQGDGFLQRATSVVRRQRPVSAIFAAAPSTQGSEENSHNSNTLTSRHSRPLSSSGQPLQQFRQPTANEDPTTAPSIPLGRASSVSANKRGGRAGGHARISSLSGPTASNLAASSSGTNPSPSYSSSPEKPRPHDLPGAAGIVNQMYRGANSPSNPPISPLMSPGGTRGAYFGSVSSSTAGGSASITSGGAGGSSSSALRSSSVSGTSGATSSGAGAGAGSAHPPRTSSESAASVSGGVGGEEHHGAASGAASITDTASTGPASPPRDRAGNTQYTGAVMQQNRLRPLRLVQESVAEDAAALAARKKANRSSWMGWFNRGAQDGAGPPVGGLGPGLGSMDE